MERNQSKKRGVKKKAKEEKNKKYWFVNKWVFIGGIILLIIIANLGKDKNSENTITEKKQKSSNDKRFLAYNYSTQYVKQKLKSPSTAKFPNMFEKINHIKDLGNDQYFINSWVDSQNGFGAMIRSEFSCKITIKEDVVSVDDLAIK